MFGPHVSVDLEKIERNARTVVSTCRKSGIEVFGVTKGTCGMPQVARAMLRGGVVGIGESRFENIRRLRSSGIDCPIMLLRSPPLSRIEEVITSVDISLNSELAIIRELSRVAERMARVHDIILMLDLGDLREGIWPDDLEPTVETVQGLSGVRIAGIGTNLTCFGAILPTEENMGALLEHARKLERSFGLQLRYVSGGNSSSLPLLLSGRMPPGINNLRIGEAILQGGRDTFLEEPWRALDRDAFLLTGELLEVKTKPSLPIGTMGVDAFGRRPVFEDKGDRLRGILNIGREDVVIEGLTPVDSRVVVLGASSDHLVVDLAEMSPPPVVGNTLSFHMSYGALLAAMTSEYVEKEPMLDKLPRKKASRVRLLVEQNLRSIATDFKLKSRFASLGLEASVSELLPTPPGASDTEPCQAQEQPIIQSEVTAALAENGTPLLLGSDHSISLAGLRALSRSVDAFGLLWFDATASFMPPTDGGRADPAGTVLSRALGYDPNVRAIKPQLSPENVVLIGLRDVAPHEAEIIKESRVTVFTIADIDALGIREVMLQALRTAMAGTKGFYVTYCPAVTDIPGTISGSGGITLRETHQAMEIIAQTKAMLAMDAVGLGPGQERRIVAETCNFIMSCFGKQIL
jgi:predicted amino acid racemase/arginase family enzyme